MVNNSAPTYHLVFTTKQRQQLKTWAERAAALDRTAEYLTVLKAIHLHLTTDPLTWGDPWYRLGQLGLQIYHRACIPMHISYAVDTARQIVYIRRFTLFSGSGLE